jgi:hypothetical protein
MHQPQIHSAVGRIKLGKIQMTTSGIEPATFRIVVQPSNCVTEFCFDNEKSLAL